MGRHALLEESPRTTVLPESIGGTVTHIGRVFARSAETTRRHSHIALGDKATTVTELLKKYGKATEEPVTEYVAAPAQQPRQLVASAAPQTTRIVKQDAAPVVAEPVSPAITPIQYSETKEPQTKRLVPDFPKPEDHRREIPLLTHGDKLAEKPEAGPYLLDYPLLTHDRHNQFANCSGATAEETVESWRPLTDGLERTVGELVVRSVAIADTGVDAILPITLPLVHVSFTV